MADNPYAKYLQPGASGGPVMGAPPKPPEPKTSYRTISPEEAAQRGLPPLEEGQVYQISSEGNVTTVGRTPKQTAPTEYQSKSNQFYSRMLTAEKQYRDTPPGDRDARTMGGQWFHDTLPSIDASLNSSGRVTSDNSARNWIAASLRQESGAAISQGEFENQYRIFFPMPGDTEKQIREKAIARQQAMEGFKSSAGPLAAEAEKQYKDQFGDVLPWQIPIDGTPPNDNPFDGLPGKAKGAPEDWTGSDGVLTGSVHGNAADFDANGNFIGDPNVEGGSIDPAIAAHKAKLDAIINERGVDTSTAGNAAYDHVAQGATLGLTDELSGVGGAISALFQNRPVIDSYRDSRDATRLMLQRETQASPYASGLTEFAGGLLVPVKGGAAANSLADIAKTGAVYGGAAGFGYGKGAAGSATNALLGAAGGAIAAPLVSKGVQMASPYAGKVVNALAGRGKVEATQEATDLVAAGVRQDVPARRPDLDPSVRGKLSGLEKTDKGGPIIRDAASQDAASIEAGVARVGGAGNPGDRFATGNIARDALERHGVRTKQAANVRYQRAEQLSGDPAIEPAQAIAKVAEAVAKLEGAGVNSNSAEIKLLRGLGEDLSAPGGKNISQLRDLRTNIRTQLKASGLDRTPAEARVLGIMDAFSADIERGLAGNKPALDAYKLGDKIWRERAAFRQQITNRLLGPADRPHSAEATASAVESMMKNDSARFKDVLSEFSPGERADFNATVAANLGRNAKGEFSLPILLNHLDPRQGKFSPRVISDLFGADGAKALADLQALSRAKMAAMSERNTSNTGNPVTRAAGGLKTLLLSALGFGGGGVPGMVAAPMAGKFLSNLGEERAARLLTNPDVTKWLRNMPEATNPKAINAYFGRLESLAARTPGMLIDVKAFQRALIDSLAESPMRAAASPEQERNTRREPPAQ